MPNRTPTQGTVDVPFLTLTPFVTVVVLAAAVAQQVTCPDAALYTHVNFSANGDFYAALTHPATVPSATSSVGTSSALNPATRDVTSITSFSLIAATATTVTMEWFR